MIKIVVLLLFFTMFVSAEEISFHPYSRSKSVKMTISTADMIGICFVTVLMVASYWYAVHSA